MQTLPDVIVTEKHTVQGQGCNLVHNSDLQNSTEGNGKLIVIKVRWLEAITSLSETSYGDNNVL